MTRTMDLSHIIRTLRSRKITVQAHENRIVIRPRPESLTPALIKLFKLILNRFENKYAITLAHTPYCLIPYGEDHLRYEKTSPRQQQDTICARCDMRTRCPGWDTQITRIPRQRIKALRDVPGEIVFEVLSQCNNNCVICASSKNRVHLSPKKILVSLAEAKRLGIRTLRFTGGEPLLSPHIVTYLRWAKESGFYVILNTNATLATKKNMPKIARYVDNLVISLQGYDPISDQAITRSAGRFAQKIKAIKIAAALFPTVRAGTVISAALIQHFNEYAALIQTLNVSSWELYRPMIARKMAAFKTLNLHKDDFIRLIKTLHQHKGLPVSIANPLPFCITADLDTNATVLRGALRDDGHSRLVLGAQGFFKPSYFIPLNLGTTITEAWAHPWIQKVRSLDYLPQQCKKCFYLTWCRGGSRFHAYLQYDDYFRVDPLAGCTKKKPGKATVNYS